MPRVSRMVVTDSGQKAAYHVISRTALDGLPFGKVEKGKRGQALYAGLFEPLCEIVFCKLSR